ncbi:MAG: tetratricopeptide repeat protein [Oscillospiraceae bacterium]|jgi:tetratricopeptide (TPR) repeat protein|nr:tetratricopeptide repeat protein [Oscillospiraceae bacterium]
MLTEELREMLLQWHEENKHRRIVAAIWAIPEAQRDSETVGLLARALNNDRRYAEAVEQLERIREESIGDACWHFRMGYARFHQRKYRQALEYLTRAAQLDPDDPDAPELIAQAKLMLKNDIKFGAPAPEQTRAQEEML